MIRWRKTCEEETSLLSAIALVVAEEWGRMDGGEEIGMVLARTSELRSKVNGCITDRASRRRQGDESLVGGMVGEEGEVQELEEDESLVGIRDALASLERQLSSLQHLHQQQLYERESTLSQIDRGRMILLTKLKEYNGEDMEVIHEAAAFAGETVRRDDDLLLPPYPRQVQDTLVLDDLYSSNFISRHKPCESGVNGLSAKKGNKNNDSSSGNGMKSLGSTIWSVVKSAITVAGFMSFMSLSGISSKLGGKGVFLDLSHLFQKSAGDEKHVSIECPPGKVMFIEDGEAHCVVKERVEIPFDSDVAAPNLSYGFG